MSIVYKPLSAVSTAEIRNCFNEAFKNYYVPLHLDESQFEAKLVTEAIDLSLSFGCFDEELLVGFILHGIDHVTNIYTAYNAGTGVLPGYRGKGLSYALYMFCLEELKNAGVKRTILEVFQQNTAAIKTYQKAGFSILREINSYKGRPVLPAVSLTTIEEVNEPDWQWITAISSWQPAWQYGNASLQRGWKQYRCYIARDNNINKGFIVFNSANGRIARMGITDEDDINTLHSLLAYVSDLFKGDLSAIHIESSLVETVLQNVGMRPFILSYEMEQLL